VTEFFTVVGTEFDIKQFEAVRFFADGDVVLVHCRMRATIRSTGKALEDGYEFHLWRFDGRGKVVAFRHLVDSHHHWLLSRR
jgi:ketosteroid isomerase-like protein